MGYRPGTAAGDGRLADPRPLRARRAAAPGRAHLGVLRPSASASCRPSSPPYETGERGSGEPSRWTADRELEWVELRPELVVEVSYDHVSDGRIRHGTKIVRWRDDKPPRECTIDQLRRLRERRRHPAGSGIAPARRGACAPRGVRVIDAPGGCRAREGCTRGPRRAFGKFGGQGASASPLRRVARGELEQAVERARRGRRSSAAGSPRSRSRAGHGVERAAPPGRRRRPRPSRTGTRRARRGRRAPSRRRRPCGRGRSGCSRRRRRRAPPSTTCSSRGPASAARPRARARARRGGPRRSRAAGGCAR